MQDSSDYQPLGRARRGIKLSVAIALALLTWDAGHTGSFLLSIFVCPIWFVFSLVKNAFSRTGWMLAVVRTAIPAVTLGIVLANSALQNRIAEANARRIIAACEEFRAANGRFPKTLNLAILPDTLAICRLPPMRRFPLGLAAILCRSRARAMNFQLCVRRIMCRPRFNAIRIGADYAWLARSILD